MISLGRSGALDKGAYFHGEFFEMMDHDVNTLRMRFMVLDLVAIRETMTRDLSLQRTTSNDLIGPSESRLLLTGLLG